MEHSAADDEFLKEGRDQPHADKAYPKGTAKHLAARRLKKAGKQEIGQGRDQV